MKVLVSILSWNYSNKALNLANKFVNNADFKVSIIENGVHPLFSIIDKSKINSKIDYFKLKENNGYASDHLLNLKNSNYEKYDGVLILNPDIKLNDDFLEELYKLVLKTNNKSIIGGPIYQIEEGVLSKEYFGYPISNEINEELNKAQLLEEKIKLDSELIINHLQDIHGCMFYIPTKIILDKGWMDSNYFLYGEENDYFFNLNKEVNILVSSSLPVLHENSGSFKLFSKKLENIKDYYTSRNKLYNIKKHFGLHSALKTINYKFIIKYFIARYIFRMSRFQLESKEYYAFIGTIHFFLNKMGRQINPNDYVR